MNNLLFGPSFLFSSFIISFTPFVSHSSFPTPFYPAGVVLSVFAFPFSLFVCMYIITDTHSPNFSFLFSSVSLSLFYSNLTASSLYYFSFCLLPSWNLQNYINKTALPSVQVTFHDFFSTCFSDSVPHRDRNNKPVVLSLWVDHIDIPEFHHQGTITMNMLLYFKAITIINR